jgi:hypothetical protein
MRSALTRFLFRSNETPHSAARAELDFDLLSTMLSVSNSQCKPQCSATERAFSEGSVMIW